MSHKSGKFDPAVLPVDAMKGFERDDTGAEARHFLYPGQLFVSREPAVVTTILGSCAALCLWDRHKKIGGMNHYLLPEGDEVGAKRLRYGNIANPELLRELLALGCEIKHLQAKVFGGSSAFAADPTQSLGARNVQLAEEFVHNAGIRLVAKEVSGKHGRRLIFHTYDGVTVIRDFSNRQ